MEKKWRVKKMEKSVLVQFTQLTLDIIKTKDD